MPWTTKDAKEKNSAIKSDKEARMWVHIANTTLTRLLAKGLARDKAEARAIRAAHSAVAEMHRKGGPKRESLEESTELREYVSSRGLQLNVDREQGLVRGVKVLGFTSRNGRRYSQEAVRKALPMYEGIGVNVDHLDPKQQRSYRERIGYLCRAEVRQDGIFADLRVNPKHALAEQLFWDAEHAPQNVGLSHDASGKTARRNGESVVESIDIVRSVDLVAEPASTAGLFESLNTEGNDMPETDVLDLKEATLEDVQQHRPDLVDLIKNELAEADDLKAKDAEIADLKAKLKEAADRDAAAKLKEAVLAELKEAKLDEPGETFLGVLLGEKDQTKRKALIDDRRKLVEAAGRAGKPKSDFAGTPPSDDAGGYQGRKAWTRKALPIG